MNKSNPPPKIIIAGAGSIGFFIGGLLHAAGHTIHFLARQRMVEKIATNGLQLTDYTGLNIKIDANELHLETDPDCLNDADVVLVTVKSAATHEMAKLIHTRIKQSSTIISLQNGLSNSEILKQALLQHEVLAGMVPFNVAQMEGGRFHRGTSGDIIIETSKRNIAAKLNSDILAFEQSSNMPSIQSGKLLINLNNALNALSGLTLLEQLNNRHWRKLMANQMREAHEIMKLVGLKPKPPSPVPASLIPHILRLPTPLFKIIAKRMLFIDPHAKSSMLEDLELGRKTEIDELQGEIVKTAKRLGLKAPANHRIMTKIKEAEALQKGSPHLRPEDAWLTPLR